MAQVQTSPSPAISAPASAAPAGPVQAPPARQDAGAGSRLSSDPASEMRRRPLHLSARSRGSQDTATTDEADQVFTPPASDSNNSEANGHDSSQESQLLQLSEVAVAQERMQGVESTAVMSPTLSPGAASRKRMADGMVKHARDRSGASSPVRLAAHSRNTSTVSVASTTGSRISELSAELKARLSYAMVKVNNGWQSRTIDEVEALASHAASPASSTSTVHGRRGASGSPLLPVPTHGPACLAASTASLHQFSARAADPSSGEPTQNPAASPQSFGKGMPTLAPPISLLPAHPRLNSRRNSNTKYTPAFFSASDHTSPHSPVQTSPVRGTPDHRLLHTPAAGPVVFSPHQNVREQDAIESLLFMSSPGNSANLKHAFPPSSQPLPPNPIGSQGSATSPQRTALPGARKSLPSGRPSHSQPLPHAHSQPKRVGFDTSPSAASEMDMDDQLTTPHAQTRSTPRGKPSAPRQRPSLSLPAGLSGTSRPRPELGDADIERMLDRAAAVGDDSDSESEIDIPMSGQSRREGASMHA